MQNCFSNWPENCSKSQCRSLTKEALCNSAILYPQAHQRTPPMPLQPTNKSFSNPRQTPIIETSLRAATVLKISKILIVCKCSKTPSFQRLVLSKIQLFFRKSKISTLKIHCWNRPNVLLKTEQEGFTTITRKQRRRLNCKLAKFKTKKAAISAAFLLTLITKDSVQWRPNWNCWLTITSMSAEEPTASWKLRRACNRLLSQTRQTSI